MFILDTSVIIDGRIARICETGFLDGKLIVPRFIIQELQQVADSADDSKRSRGRRGLDILNMLKTLPNVEVIVHDESLPNVKEVDAKLVRLAKILDCRVITNDFNLNKVAKIEGVIVMNVNDLANALRLVIFPGEEMSVYIRKEGKEKNQGVAFMDDGTMIVVDNARRLLGKQAKVSVTSVLQTSAGRMIFASLMEREGTENGQSPSDQRDRSRDQRNRSHSQRDRNRPHEQRDRSHEQRDRSHEQRDRSHEQRDRSHEQRDRSHEQSDRPQEQSDRPQEQGDRPQEQKGQGA
jgi:rRNA-processing protein FCF1